MHPTALFTTLLAFLLPLQVASIFATPNSHIFKNGPVISTGFQDPSLIQVNETWYAFAGANGNPPNINVQMATSPDFSTWTLTG
jgi:sucrose-6-phosphate hydrolase SacC (GH32 family)